MKKKSLLEPNYNYGKNTEYLIRTVKPNFEWNSYEKNITFKGMDIGKTTLNAVVTHGSATENTLKKIAAAFSNYYTGETEDSQILHTDLGMDPDDFVAKYPSVHFYSDPERRPHEFIHAYSNILYRGYYKIPYENRLMIAYFKLFHTNRGNRAFLIRGVTSPESELEDKIIQIFQDSESIKSEFKKLWTAVSEDATLTGMHICEAADRDIICTPNNIKISFTSHEPDEYQTEMVWITKGMNKNLKNKMPKDRRASIYTAGISVILDTMDGHQNDDIRVFKLGLEAIDCPVNPRIVTTLIRPYPFSTTSPLLLNELNMHSKEGVSLAYFNDDYHFYKLCQSISNRSKEYNNRDIEMISKAIRQMQKENSKEFKQLKAMIEKIEAKEKGN